MSAYDLARNWWLIGVRGLLTILFGLSTLAWQTTALSALAPLTGVYLLTDGLLAVLAGLTRRHGSQPWWLLLVEGAAGLLTGVLALLSAGLPTLALLYLIAAWAIFIGIVEMVSAIRLRAEVDNEGFLAARGVLSAALGLGLMIWPGPAVGSLVWILGACALVLGALLIGLGFRLWNWQNLSHPALSPVRAGRRRNHP